MSDKCELSEFFLAAGKKERSLSLCSQHPHPFRGWKDGDFVFSPAFSFGAHISQ